jgi:hypothetical protein
MATVDVPAALAVRDEDWTLDDDEDAGSADPGAVDDHPGAVEDHGWPAAVAGGLAGEPLGLAGALAKGLAGEPAGQPAALAKGHAGEPAAVAVGHVCEPAAAAGGHASEPEPPVGCGFGRASPPSSRTPTCAPMPTAPGPAAPMPMPPMPTQQVIAETKLVIQGHMERLQKLRAERAQLMQRAALLSQEIREVDQLMKAAANAVIRSPGESIVTATGAGIQRTMRKSIRRFIPPSVEKRLPRALTDFFIERHITPVATVTGLMESMLIDKGWCKDVAEAGGLVAQLITSRLPTQLDAAAALADECVGTFKRYDETRETPSFSVRGGRGGSIRVGSRQFVSGLMRRSRVSAGGAGGAGGAGAGAGAGTGAGAGAGAGTGAGGGPAAAL